MSLECVTSAVFRLFAGVKIRTHNQREHTLNIQFDNRRRRRRKKNEQEIVDGKVSMANAISETFCGGGKRKKKKLYRARTLPSSLLCVSVRFTTHYSRMRRRRNFPQFSQFNSFSDLLRITFKLYLLKIFQPNKKAPILSNFSTTVNTHTPFYF